LKADYDQEGDVIDDSLEMFVLNALKNHRNIHSVLIPQICEKTGWDWDQSAQYIDKVKSLHGFELSSSNYRTYLIIGTVTGLGGLGLMVLAFELYIGMGAFSHCFSMGFHEPWQKIIGSSAFQQCLGIDAANFANFYQMAFFGLLMLVGSIIGIIVAYEQLRA